MLATVGWVIGLPVGWLLFRGLLVVIRNTFDVEITAEFPTAGPAITLISTLAVSALVIRPALRRAVRTEPGAALRHQ